LSSQINSYDLLPILLSSQGIEDQTNFTLKISQMTAFIDKQNLKVCISGFPKFIANSGHRPGQRKSNNEITKEQVQLKHD